MLARLESQTAPGRPEDWRVERFQHDHGTEFEGVFKQALESRQTVNTHGEVGRHTACARIENRNNMLAIMGTAMGYTATTANENITKQIHGELVTWAHQILCNNMITSHQKEVGNAAFKEQTGRESPLTERPIFTFGSLDVGFISKKDRNLKMGARSIMGVWAGLDNDVDDAHRVIPISWENDAWKPLPTHDIVCVTVRVYEGVLPLRSAPDNTAGLIEDAPPALSPSEVKAIDAENDEQVTETTVNDGEYTVDSIVDHAHHTDGGDTKFRVRYEGYDSNEDGWFTAAQIPNCQSLLDSCISENKEYYEKDFVFSGAVNVLRAFQEDVLLYEQESQTMRQAARAHASALPAYPVFQNKEQYEQLNSEEQLEYREQATLSSEARRRILMDTVGCSYSTARDSLRSGTKDLDNVVEHALYMTYMEPNSDTQPISDPNTDPEGTPTLNQVYLSAEPAPRHIMDRTDPAALPGSALSYTADDRIMQGCIQDTALSTMLRCSYSAEDSIMHGSRRSG